MTDRIFAPGLATFAEYHVPAIREYRGNPYLEALPPTLEREEARQLMTYLPEYDDTDRSARAIDREHMASLLSAVRFPVGIHLELHSRLSRLLRNGYVARNPISPFFQQHIDARERALKVEGDGAKAFVSSYPMAAGPRPSANGLTFLGLPGIGKTVALDMCLRLYPQLLVHTEYQGKPFHRTQLVWLRLDAPSDGSILSLAEKFFMAVDELHAAVDTPTNYRNEYMPSRTTVQQVIPRMARLAAQHGLGMLVLDEIQDLNARGSRGLLAFLVQLVNTVGIPVVLAGGIDALPILAQQFRQARRGATEGDLIVRRAETGTHWRRLCEVIWRYQYTRTPTPMTDAHVAKLYDMSQGITEILVVAYKLAQVRAISRGGDEEITPRHIEQTKDSLTQAYSVLRALKEKNSAVLRHMRDVVLPEGYQGMPFVPGDPKRPAERAAPMEASMAPGAQEPDAAPAERPASDPEGNAAPAAAPRPSKRGTGTRKGTPRPHREVASPEGRAAPWGEAAEPLTVGPPLYALVQAARAAGQTAPEALREAGVLDDPLWHRLSGQTAD